MKICTQKQGDILYIRLVGELDEHNAALARKEADMLAEEHAATIARAVFDLSEVSFMDSTGIGFLIGRYKKFNRYGVPVAVTNPSLATDRILCMSGIYTLMPKI